MKIIVTGATGFIGSHLVERLRNIGHDPVTPPRICDLRSASCCQAYIEPCDVLFHCAGVTTGSGGAGPGGINLVNDNVIMALRVFKAAAEVGVKRIVSMSSTTGYPDLGGNLTYEDEYFKGEVHPAYSAIGEAKRFVERISMMYPQIETVWLRCSGAYGPRSNFDLVTSHVIEATIRKVAEKQNPIVVWGDGTDRRDGVYIDDLIDALIASMSCSPGAYNIATGMGMKVFEILQCLMSHAKHFPEVQFDTSKPKMIHERILYTMKAGNKMGWIPKVSMEEGLKKTYDWYVKEMLP